MKRGRPRMKDRSKVVKDKTVHVPLSTEQYDKMAEMAKTDRRSHTEWVRLLIEDEWKRRSIAELEPQVGAAPAA